MMQQVEVKRSQIRTKKAPAGAGADEGKEGLLEIQWEAAVSCSEVFGFVAK